MSGDFLNFFLLYVMLTVTFLIVGNINFIYDLPDFKDLFTSALTVINASIGNFEMEIFNNVKDKEMGTFGQIFMIVIVVTFNILLMNFIFAIFANTYSIFDSRSSGLFLSEILRTRDEVLDDPSFGAYLASIPPINAIQILFIPVTFLFR